MQKMDRVYHQMLKNHKKPPGPFNRGERSALIYDKRPLAEQILTNIRDVEKTTKDGSEFKDFKDLMANSSEDIDDVFINRELGIYFK